MLMKYLLPLLLLSIFCSAQQTYNNYTKVTAFRMVREEVHGPCTIKNYIKQTPAIGQKIQACQFNDEKLAYALAGLKREARQWQKKPLKCNDSIYGMAVPYMYVVEINRYRDTIYATSGNAGIFFPDEQVEYIDPNNRLDSLFSKDLVTFVNRDYYTELLIHKNDSLPVSKALLDDKPFFGRTRKGFEKNIMKFQLARTDSLFEPLPHIQKEYWINNYKVRFGKKGVATVNAYNLKAVFPKKVAFAVGEISIGDPEEKLWENYPDSTFFRNWGAPLSDISNNYFYQVHFEKEKGYAIFYIKDKIVNEIEVTFPED